MKLTKEEEQNDDIEILVFVSPEKSRKFDPSLRFSATEYFSVNNVVQMRFYGLRASYDSYSNCIVCVESAFFFSFAFFVRLRPRDRAGLRAVVRISAFQDEPTARLLF